MADRKIATSAERNAAPTEISAQKMLGIFAVTVMIWAAVTAAVLNRVVEDRVAAYLARERADIAQRMVSVGRQFELVLNRLRGVPAVVAAGRDVISVLAEFGPKAVRRQEPLDVLRKNLAARGDLQMLGRQFAKTAEELEVDVIWVMNASGDAVAASNFATATSFVGVNYADRKYFTSVLSGMRGYQYAVGRVTNVPGLYFSSPVTSAAGFLGVVVVKVDMPRLAPWVNRSEEFVTDENGVIILSGDPRLEMRVIDAAPTQRMSVAQREGRYKRAQFEAMGITPFTEQDIQGLVRVAGSDVPHFFRTSVETPEGLKVHILRPAHGIETIRRDGITMFALLVFAGMCVVALLIGVHVYLLRIRQHRQSMQATNRKLSDLNTHLELLSRTDPLTGCANRRYFQECMDGELDRARRYSRPCSVLMLDIDWFKKVNDRHGHAAGDEALRHVVRLIGRVVRRQDTVGRLGGEEFAVLMPETDFEHAFVSAERIRATVAAEPARFGDTEIPLTVSIGVAFMLDKVEAESADRLLLRADHWLYAAKSAGRNCVMPALPAAA